MLVGTLTPSELGGYYRASLRDFDEGDLRRARRAGFSSAPFGADSYERTTIHGFRPSATEFTRGYNPSPR